jgi:uncharacterized Zn finger protein (UPF0148 family)
MKVHRCPHCTKPFLESEARTGKCPVCQEVVWDTPEPKPETNSEPEAEHDSGPGAPEQPGKSKTPKAPRRPVSIAIPLLLIVILGGGALWWFQVQDLQTQRDDLRVQLSQAEGKRGVAAHRGSAARAPQALPSRLPSRGNSPAACELRLLSSRLLRTTKPRRPPCRLACSVTELGSRRWVH